MLAHYRLCMVLGTTVVALSFILLGPVLFPIATSPLQVGIAMAVHGVGMAANFIGNDLGFLPSSSVVDTG
jgi:hypothetical protein